VTTDPPAHLAVDVDIDGPAAPPRRNGELIFDAPWQGRAFGMCVAVLEREGLGWDAFRAHLVPTIERMPDADYYDQFAVALDAFIQHLGLT
jgi:hypothetical protein